VAGITIHPMGKTCGLAALTNPEDIDAYLGLRWMVDG
jgi:hypothetical protein